MGVTSWSEQLRSKAQELLDDGFRFHAASNGALESSFDLAPLGIPVSFIDFLRAEGFDVNGLLSVFNALNGISFGPSGIPMDRWVMIDLGLLPSAFLVVTLPRDRVEALAAATADADEAAKLTALLDAVVVNRYGGPVPVAGYCAAPSPREGHWAGWSLCSVVNGRGLATVAKGLALAMYRARSLVGVTQYDNPALRIHRKFGQMRLLAAEMPLHPVAHTLVYSTAVGVEQAPEPPTWRVRAEDTARHKELQMLISQGTHTLYVQSPGLDEDGCVPIRAVPSGR